MPHPELQLLIRTHRGDEQAAERLWSRFSPSMIAYARSIVGDADAHDIVQSVFLSILKLPRRRLRQVEDVPAWLLHLTRNAALNEFRSNRRARRRIRRRDLPQKAPPFDADHQDLAAAIDRLPRRDRELIILKHIAGLTFDQVAIALGANRNTAAARYRGALDRLRRQLNHLPELVTTGSSQ